MPARALCQTAPDSVLTLDEVKPGLSLGRYEFLLPIARGGMAAVWAARARGARGFQRTVAIKTMLPTLSADPHFETMFLDEARIASRIRHPNVVEIVDLGEQDSLLYIVMEWIDGEPLSTLMRKAGTDGQLPMGISARIMADTCAGLHAAHELRDDDGGVVGLVHRDISPQNIMVSYDGIVKLLDFGVAKAAGNSTVETAAGHVKGKIAYMAPEQVLGERVDRRTDVFACGIVLYQITTGRHPFRGEVDAATLHNVLRRDVPSPRHFVSDCPPRLHQIVMKALQRDREKRFQTAAEMANELEELARVGGTRTTTLQVAEFIRASTGSIGEERRGMLKKALQDADGRQSSTAAMLATAADPVQHTPASGSHIIKAGDTPAGLDSTHSSVSIAGALSTTGSSLSSEPPPATRRRMVGGAIVIGVVAAVCIPLIGLALLRPRENPPATPAQQPATSAEASASALAVATAPASTPVDSAPSESATGAASAVVAATPPTSSAPEPSTAPVQTAAPVVPVPGSTKAKGPATKGGGTKGGWVPPLADPGF